MILLKSKCVLYLPKIRINYNSSHYSNSMSEGSSIPENQIRELREGPLFSKATIYRMLFYTLLMITCPILSYFVSKAYFFEGFLGFSEDDSIVPSAFTAVLVVHIILALFIYAAFTEEIPAKPKQD